MKKIIVLLYVLSAISINAQAGKKDKAKEADREIADRVATWQITHFTQVKHNNLDWTNGALYRGMIEWAEYTGEQKYFDFLMDIGRKNNWGFLPRVYHADDLCVAQMYIGMYNRYGDKSMIQPTIERLDKLVASPSTDGLQASMRTGRDRWWWCDALFMAPPVFVGIYNITGDEKLLEFVDREYKVTTDSLFSYEDGMYFRDHNFVGDQREANGRKIFWGRGNGWVYGGLTFMLEQLPKEHPAYGFYLDLYERMSDAVIKCQDDNGSWHASMYDHQAYPLAENSASSFFTYGLAWGVNHGVLKGAKYKKAARKGWKTLKTYVNADGKLGSIQPIGYAPASVTADMTEVYGVGAFLLAATEILEMK